MPFISGAAESTPDTQQTGAQQSLGGLDSEAFLTLLVAQMRYQDPMQPADHTAMLQQTAQFTQVEALQSVTQMQQQLLGLGQASTASQLVGEEIDAQTSEGLLSGTVRAVRFSSSGPILDVDGTDVPFQHVLQIRASGAEVPPPPVNETASDEPAPDSDLPASGLAPTEDPTDT